MLFTTELRRVLGAATVLLLSTSQIAAAFSPPQVFKNTNLLRTIDVSKGYIQQTIAVIIENTSERPQSEYFLPISQDELARVSYIAAKDKKEGTVFTTSLVTDDPTYVDPCRFSWFQLQSNTAIGVKHNTTKSY